MRHFLLLLLPLILAVFAVVDGASIEIPEEFRWTKEELAEYSAGEIFMQLGNLSKSVVSMKDDEASDQHESSGTDVSATPTPSVVAASPTPSTSSSSTTRVEKVFGDDHIIVIGLADVEDLSLGGDSFKTIDLKTASGSFLITPNGNVGINLHSDEKPTAKLDVNGDIAARGMLWTSKGGVKFPDGTIQETAYSPDAVANVLKTLSAQITNQNSFGPNGALYISADGKIGVGTTAPTSSLTVAGVIEVVGKDSGIKFPDGTIQTSAFDRNSFNSAMTAQVGIMKKMASELATTKAGLIEMFQSRRSLGPNDAVWSDDNGNIGIGTKEPKNKLSVSGSIQSLSGGFVFPDGTVQMSAYDPATMEAQISNITSFGNGAITVSSNGFVGIQNKKPSFNLDVTGSIRVSSSLVFGDGTKQITAFDEVKMKKSLEYLVNMIETKNSFGPHSEIFISTEGRVGIRTQTPKTELHVAGVVQADAIIFIDGTKQSTAFDSTGIKSAIAEQKDAAVSLVNRMTIFMKDVQDQIKNKNSLGSNDEIFVDGKGNVGIGTKDLSDKLTVNGSIKISTGQLIFGDGSSQVTAYQPAKVLQWIKDLKQLGGASGITVAENGYVGIGNATPSYRLDVAGDMRISGVLTFGDGSVQRTAFDDKKMLKSLTSLQSYIDSKTSFFGTALFIDKTTGYVGIGEKNPTARLHVAGDAFIQGGILFNDKTLQTTAFDPSIIDKKILSIRNIGGRIFVTDTGNVGVGVDSPKFSLEVAGILSASKYSFPDGTQQTTAYQPEKLAEVLNFLKTKIDSKNSLLGKVTVVGENVGINTDQPQAKLDVNGTIRAAEGILFADKTLQTTAFRPEDLAVKLRTLKSLSDGALIIDDKGNVGVGTKRPQAMLSVAGTIQSAAGGFKFPDDTLQTTAYDSDATEKRFVSIERSVADINNLGLVGNILGKNGNIGIGTSDPQQKLDVAGSIKLGESLIFGDGTVQKTAFDAGILKSMQVTLKTALGKAYDAVANINQLGDGIVYVRDNFVGINNKYPKTELDVAGTINVTKGIQFPDGKVQTTAYIPSTGAPWSLDSENNKEKEILYVNSLGNVGIGVARGAQHRLHVKGNTYLQGRLMVRIGDGKEQEYGELLKEAGAQSAVAFTPQKKDELDLLSVINKLIATQKAIMKELSMKWEDY